MPWTVLLLAAGSMAIPAPSILIVPPHPSSQEDPIYIECMAPWGFPGANFTLYRGDKIIQLLQAPEDQLRVTFNLSGGSWEATGVTFHCQYGVLGEHKQLQLSDLSESVHISFPGPSWILALFLSLGGALLLAGLVAVAVVIRKGKVKELQKKRERESCWAQINFTTTGEVHYLKTLWTSLLTTERLQGLITSLEDMSFDNSLFSISMKMTSEGDIATLDACSGSAATPENSGPRKRPTSTSSSPEPPEFSTFRACQ